MWNIIKREIKSFFDSPVAYILIIVFLVIGSFFYFRIAYIQGFADLRPLFDILPWILLFFVPAVSMKMLAEEKRNSTLDLLLSQPVKRIYVLIGKWLSVVVFTSFSLALTVFIPLTLSAAGKFDWGQIAAQYIGAVFFILAFAGLGIWSSSLTKSQIASFILSLFVGFFFIMSGVEIVIVETKGIVREIFSQLSILVHYQNMIRGSIDLRDIIYFISFAGLFLILAYLQIYKLKASRKSRDYRLLKTAAVILIVILVVINLLGRFIPGRIDLTREKLFSLSPATEKIIKNIDDIVTIKLFISSDLPPQVLVVKRDVLDILNDLDRLSDNLQIDIVNIKPDGEGESEARDFGISPVQFNIMKNQQFTLQRGYFGLAVVYADKKEVIPYIGDTSNLEYQVVRMIYRLTNNDKKSVGILSGQGEKDISQISIFRQELSKEYDIKEIDIPEDNSDFDIEADVLAVIGPSDSFSDNQKEIIKKFIEEGGSVFLAADGVNVDEQFLTAAPTGSNYNDIISDYGLKIMPNLVYDLRSNESISFGGGPLTYILPYPFWVRAQVVDTKLVSANIPAVLLLWPSSIQIEEKDNVEITPLLSTTQFGGLQEGFFNIAPNADFGDNTNIYILSAAALVKNQNSEQAGRVVVVGDSDFIDNRMFRGSSSPNLIFALNSIDWLAQNIDLVNIRSKSRVPQPLVFEKSWQQAAARYINLIGIPALVAVWGLWWIWRRKRLSKLPFSEDKI